MRIKLGLYGILMVGILMVGCARKASDLTTEAHSLKMEESAYRTTSKDSQIRQLMNTKVRGNFVNSSVYYAVSQVAKSKNIAFDRTFVPSSTYKVTMNFKGTLGEFLDVIFRYSGIRYSYRDGILKVFNKKNVEEAYKERPCGKRKPNVIMSFDSVRPSEFFKEMSRKYKMNFSFDTRYYNLKPNTQGEFVDGQSGKAPMPSVAFYYKGCDEQSAIRKFIEASDLTITENGKNSYKISDYEIVEFDVPTYFNIDFTSSGAGVQSNSGSQSGSGGSQNTISHKEDIKEEFKRYIKQHLSDKGTVHVSSGRGYIVAVDKPSYIRGVKKIMRIENRRQSAIDLSVSVIRIDLKDELSMGVDWSKALSSIADKLGYDVVNIGVNYASQVAGGLELKTQKNGLTNMVKALQEYGNAKIVRDFRIKTRSGILSTFRAVEEIPYITTSVINNGGVSQVATEAKTASSGLIISIIPSLVENGERVNLASSVSISEYRGDKIINANDGEFKLPIIATNEIQMPGTIRMNDTMVLSGMQLRQGTSTKNGVPGFSQLPGVSGGLFGLNSSKSKVSEFLVIVTPRRVRSY